MLSHYLLNFLLTTTGVIVLLYAAYLYIRRHPQLGGLGGCPTHAAQGEGPGLTIESTLNLEPRKNLHVIRYGEQRFLVATTLDKTELLTTLHAEPSSLLSVHETDREATPLMSQAPGLITPQKPLGSFMDNFKQSLRLVLAERFTRSGGKQ